jgi:hypothetical protein
MFGFKIPKRFRICLYEQDAFLVIQRRICFIWITLVDDDSEIMKFKTPQEAEAWLNKEKKFGEIFIVDYRKVKT